MPSGVLQAWPQGTPITLATAAIEMISVSDNTAADTLRDLVAGPDLERYALRNRPLLSTRALFALKAHGGAALLKRWQGARSPAEREAIMRAAERRPLPALGEYPADPRALDVEWFYSPRELCGLMSHVADLPLMSVNPGLVNPSLFRRVAFKGGSEPGVISVTTNVVTMRGTSWCLAATVNDPTTAIDDTPLRSAAGLVLAALASR
jgi:hypothetical protein